MSNDPRAGLIYARPTRRTILGAMAAGGPAATLTTALLRSAWIPAPGTDSLRRFVDDHPKLGEIPGYLEVWNRYGGPKDPQPDFKFLDTR